MSGAELLLTAVGLSMDACAVALCLGLAMKKATLRRAVVVGLYFGGFQALMPLLGYLLAKRFADSIVAYDHWFAFILLGIIGGRMVYESFHQEGCRDRQCPEGACSDRQCPNGKRPEEKAVSLKPGAMLPLALATSIDALAVGVSLAFLRMEIGMAVSMIGVITLLFSMLGVYVGSLFGTKLKSKAELVGGFILVGLGVKILLEHLGILAL